MLRGFYQYFGLHHCERQAQLGAAAGTATVDKRLESSRSKTPDELDAAERSTVVQLPFAQNLHPMV